MFLVDRYSTASPNVPRTASAARPSFHYAPAQWRRTLGSLGASRSGIQAASISDSRRRPVALSTVHLSDAHRQESGGSA